MWKNVKRFFEPLFVDKLALIKYSSRRIVGFIFDMGIIFFVQRFIGLIEIGNTEGIYNLIIIFIIFNLACTIFCLALYKWTWSEIYEIISNWIDEKYMKKFIMLDNTAVENMGTGKIISVVSKGMNYWKEGMGNTWQHIIEFIIIIFVSIYVIINVGTVYIVIFLVLLVFFLFLSFIVNKYILKYRKIAKEIEIDYDKQSVKMIMSKFEILQNSKINRELGVLRKYMRDYTKADYKLGFFLNLIAILPNMMLFICYIGAILYFMQGQVSYATITLVFLVLSYFGKILFNAIWFFKNLTKEFVAIKRMWDFFDNTDKISGLKTGKDFKYKVGNIQVENLSFSYGDKKVFENFSIKINGNSVTALVGESGGGKTTLMKLLSGFISPNSGEVMIDGQKLRDVNLLSYYKEIGYLTQEPNVFDGTIIENLTYGVKEKIEEKEIERVIKKARCEFIYEFKNGLNTEIGERGVRLSGGQKQRLAIAKIFLKNPKIIFLDEPTSALDSFSEQLIQESFKELFKGRTVVIIAHRLQTVKNADEILVFERGEVIEKGTHNSLVRKGGEYKKMLDLQSGF